MVPPLIVVIATVSRFEMKFKHLFESPLAFLKKWWIIEHMFDRTNIRNAQNARRFGGLLLSTMMTIGVVGGVTTAVAQADPQSQIPASQLTSYQTRPGDTLWGLSTRVTKKGGDVRDTIELIKCVNHLTSSSLSVGQVIRLPKE